MSDVDRPPGPGWERNPGRLPDHARGKRVGVIMANGNEAKAEGVATAPPGWSADRARWTRRGEPFDIEWFKVL